MDKNSGTFFVGLGLFCLGVLDGFSNPLAFLTPPELFTAGAGCFAMSLGIKNADGRKNTNRQNNADK